MKASSLALLVAALLGNDSGLRFTEIVKRSPESFQGATITGQVVDARTFQPLRGAIVRVQRVPSGKPDAAPQVGFRTGEDGKFILRSVAPGIVNFYVMKPGYKSGPYASARPATDGERIENVVLTVLPAASISGRVVDESGQPIAGARVITGVPDLKSQRTFSSLVSATVTDDDGQYWIGGLSAGEYAVAASPYGQAESTRDPTDPTFGQTITVKLDVGEERTGTDVIVPLRPSNTLIGLPKNSRGANVVSGRVVDTKGRSIPNSFVLLAPADEPGAGFTATTDSAGNFRITDVPAGTFGIGANAPGFPMALQLQARPSLTPMEIVVKDGSATIGVVVTLRRGAVISGALTDEFGDPVAAAVTLTAPYRSESGISGRSIATDARGRYRATGLVPGEFLLSAAWPAVAEVYFEDQPGHESIIATSPVFYPGVPRAALASRVTVAEGDESTGIDLVLRPVPVAQINVAVPANRPVKEVLLHHISIDDQMAIQKTQLLTGSSATLVVAPGRYRLIASANTPAGDRMIRLWSLVDVDANPLLPANVTMTLEPGAGISGRAVFEGSADSSRAGAGASLLSVLRLQGTKLGLTPGSATFEVATGRFSIEGIMPSQYVIQAGGPDRGRTSWILKAATINGRDVLDQPIALAPGVNIDDAVLTLTDRIGEVSGRITNADGQPASSGWVVLFSTDSAQWYRGSRRTRVVRPDEKGAYVVRGLPAGSYTVALSPDFVSQDDDLESTLRALAAIGTRVTLAEGERKVQDLRSLRR
jgi:protocatechuate 3,4-dioxygenase beta subunit